MNIRVIYVSGLGQTVSPDADPLLRQYLGAVRNDIDATPDKTIGMIVGEVCALASTFESARQAYIVIIHAFLDWEWEGVQADSTWNPSTDQLRILFGDDEPHEVNSHLRRLKSLALMWAVWERLRGRTRIFVTTDGVALTRRSERALEAAFSVGRACRMYGWKDNPLLLADLVTAAAGVLV